MGYTLEEFAEACHKALSQDEGAAGQKKVCELVKDVLKDDAFVARYLRDDLPERKILYEDPEFGFCILGHAYHGAKGSPPHDHGPTWAIYGQARGETVMTDWALVEPASAEKPGKVRKVREYRLKPGDAHYYAAGEFHSPRRDGATTLLRIEGKNVEKIRRLPYEAVDAAA